MLDLGDAHVPARWWRPPAHAKTAKLRWDRQQNTVILDAVTVDAEGRGPEQFLPLSPQQFEILLALCDQDLHGYGIIRDVSDRPAGRLRLGTGALYTAIARLVTLGLIRETDRRDDADARRRYYALTRLGRRTLAAETARLEELLAKARRKGIRAAAPKVRP